MSERVLNVRLVPEFIGWSVDHAMLVEFAHWLEKTGYVDIEKLKAEGGIVKVDSWDTLVDIFFDDLLEARGDQRWCVGKEHSDKHLTNNGIAT